jgi:hypothetical protein
LARPLVGNAENDRATAFIGEGHAVIDQLVEVKIVRRGLELQPLTFRLGQPSGDLLRRAQG